MLWSGHKTRGGINFTAICQHSHAAISDNQKRDRPIGLVFSESPEKLLSALTLSHTCRHATIYNENLTSHSLGSAKRQDLLSDVFDASCSAKDNLRSGPALNFLRNSLCHTSSFDQSGRNAIYRHIRCQCDCQAMREMDQTRLA